MVRPGFKSQSQVPKVNGYVNSIVQRRAIFQKSCPTSLLFLVQSLFLLDSFQVLQPLAKIIISSFSNLYKLIYLLSLVCKNHQGGIFKIAKARFSCFNEVGFSVSFIRMNHVANFQSFSNLSNSSYSCFTILSQNFIGCLFSIY